MKYLIYTNEAQAQLRADQAFNDAQYTDVITTKYCDVIKHTADDLWAVVVDMRMSQLFTAQEISSAQELTYDWFPIIDDGNPLGYRRMNTKSTVLIKAGSGILRKIVIGIAGTSANKIICYDNLVAAAPIIQQVSGLIVGEYNLNAQFNNGLTVTSVTGTSADFTVYFE